MRGLLGKAYPRQVLALALLIRAGFSLWGEAAEPLSFADAARMAVAASEELRSEYRMRALRERAWVLGRRAYLPRLNLGISEDDRLGTIGADSFLKNYSLSLDQLLWDGGRTAENRRVEQADLSLQGYQLERMAGEIAEAALGAYRNVLYTRMQLEIRDAALEALGEQRNILGQELELGLALAADLAGADIAVSEEEVEAASLRMELEEAERELAETLGLDRLPPLGEAVDVRRAPALPAGEQVRFQAQSRNPDLVEARHSIGKKQAELRAARLSWLPTVRLTGGFSLSGQSYPLTKWNWSLGLTVEFDSPWLSGSLQGSAGWEPPQDRTARMQNTLSPLPDPASSLTANSAELALTLEQEKYRLSLERVGRMAVLGVEKCRLSDQRRLLALKSLELAGEKLGLAELRRELGHSTRLDLMEERQNYTQRELALAEAAISLLGAERELERLLDLRPGELAQFSRQATIYGGNHE
jgi:outer membrane protein TolC